ncbi:hypothetical protein ES288_A12G193600v1 [Gossypium darwinii]|uniref:Uncharacterized protein n=1 Tax=Gossypium darwinii TaxID=34276 RepID=A0A5D2EBT0_GOSDA|nr:hypothetical protein ES288_A12G193600v1 [Gossypium darwinii]
MSHNMKVSTARKASFGETCGKTLLLSGPCSSSADTSIIP